jgi:hypothetical protein
MNDPIIILVSVRIQASEPSFRFPAAYGSYDGNSVILHLGEIEKSSWGIESCPKIPLHLPRKCLILRA